MVIHFRLETVVDVVYPAGWFHVERDRVELFGMVYELSLIHI